MLESSHLARRKTTIETYNLAHRCHLYYPRREVIIDVQSKMTIRFKLPAMTTVLKWVLGGGRARLVFRHVNKALKGAEGEADDDCMILFLTDMLFESRLAIPMAKSTEVMDS